MRILFDVLGSTEKSGGMRLHSTQVIESWTTLYPDDDIWILGPAWVSERFGRLPRVTVVEWKNESVVFRSTGQVLVSALVAARHRVDYAISLSPLVSPLIPRRKAICFQHDWRHKKNPHEFPAAQRIYRKLWEISAAHAHFNVCISEKAQKETREYVTRAETVIIANGRDHARAWSTSTHAPEGRSIVTFGHHNNKRPELVIRAVAELPEGVSPGTTLTVLGARGAYASELRGLAAELGVADRVVFPGFVDDAQYQSIVSGASVVVMASSDEGFGLPIAEAEYFGIPALVTSDSGMDEIFGSYPIVADPDPHSIASGLAVALTRDREPRGAAARSIYSWDDVADQLRHRLIAA